MKNVSIFPQKNLTTLGKKKNNLTDFSWVTWVWSQGRAYIEAVSPAAIAYIEAGSSAAAEAFNNIKPKIKIEWNGNMLTVMVTS